MLPCDCVDSNGKNSCVVKLDLVLSNRVKTDSRILSGSKLASRQPVEVCYATGSRPNGTGHFKI